MCCCQANQTCFCGHKQALGFPLDDIVAADMIHLVMTPSLLMMISQTGTLANLSHQGLMRRG